MKFLIVKTPYYYAGADYTDSGFPTRDVAPILRKLVYGMKTLDKLVSYMDTKPGTYTYEIRDIAS